MTNQSGRNCLDPVRFPKRISNRPGLPRISYRIGTYADFRRAIMRRIDESSTLSAWTHREGDDPGIALLEGACILGDILTLYQEVYANEAYLRTARWRESVADLVQLTGYRLSPGVGGRAVFAFAFKGERPATIPAGFSVKAEVEGLNDPVVFETTDSALAHPSLNAFHLYRPHRFASIDNHTNVFSVERAALKGQDLEITAGDRLLLAQDPESPASKRQIVVVKQVKEHLDRLEIEVEGRWRQGAVSASLQGYKLGRTFRHFGYNGPSEKISVDGEDVVTEPVSFERQLQLKPYTFWVIVPGYNPLASFAAMPLSAEVDDITVGTRLLVELQLGSTAAVGGSMYLFERIVEDVESASLSWGAMSGGSTVLTLDTAPVFDTNYYTDIRSVSLHEVNGAPFVVTGRREATSGTDLTTLYYFGDSDSYQLLHERTLLFEKPDGTAGQAAVSVEASSAVSGAALRPVHLTEELEGFHPDDFPHVDEGLVTVYGNLVEATQGKTEDEAVLGNGDSRETFQTFKLPKAPLTYSNEVGAMPPEVPQLEVFVDDRRWEQVPSFFGERPDTEIYVVREDAEGNSWIQFGDGKTGRRLPSGLENVVARYRTGTGAHGPRKEDSAVQPRDRLDRLDAVYLPGAASGGDEPEQQEMAREAAPGKMQSLGRLVSLKDYEYEALAIAGVSRAQALWGLFDNVPAIQLTLLMERGRDAEIDDVRRIISEYSRCQGAERFPVHVRQGRRRYVYVDVTVRMDAVLREQRVKDAVRKALGAGDGDESNGQGLFSPAHRCFGESERATKIEGIVQNVEGVQWVRATAFGAFEESADPAVLDNRSDVVTREEVVSCDSACVLVLQNSNLRLNITRGSNPETC